MQFQNERGKRDLGFSSLTFSPQNNVESDYPEDRSISMIELNKNSSLKEMRDLVKYYEDYVQEHCTILGNSQKLVNSRSLRKITLLLNIMACKFPEKREAAEIHIAYIEIKFIQMNSIGHNYNMKDVGQSMLEYQANRCRLTEMRNHLKDVTEPFRGIFNKGQIDTYASEKIHSRISSLFRDFLRNIIINQVLPFFGQPPCEFAIIPLGSTARSEMTPYSDLEFAILYEGNEGDDDIKHYFRVITEYLYIKIANLGETRIRGDMSDFPRGVDFTSDKSIPKGFTFDPGKNTPLGKKGEYELIGTPGEIIRYLDIDFIKQNSTLWTILNTVSSENIIYSTKFGSGTVIDFIRMKNALINAVDYRKYLLNSMNAVLARFRVSLGKLEDQGRVLNVKYGLYRLPNMLIDLLAIYYKLSSTSSWARLREMYEKQLISKTSYYHLISIVSTCTMLRTVVYLESNSQCDDLVVNYSGYSEESISSIFKTLLPLEIYMHEFVDSVGVEFPFYEEDAFLYSESVAQIRIYDMKDEHDELINYLENQISGLLIKNLRPYFIKDSQKVIEELENCDSVSNLIDDDNSKNNFLPWCINCLGRAYFKKSDFKKAFLVYSNASRIYPKQTAIYSHLACVYEELGNYQLAIFNHIKTIMAGIGIEYFIIKIKESVDSIIKKDNFDISVKEFKIYKFLINYICCLSKKYFSIDEKIYFDFYILNSLIPHIENLKYESELPIVLEKITEFCSVFNLENVLPRKKWMHEIIKCIPEMLSNLSLTLDKAEDYVNAELAGNLAVKFELFRSPEYPSDSLITYKHNLVNVYIHRYKFHKAVEEIAEILNVTETKSGPRSRQYVRSLKLKAEILYDLEKYDEAKNICEQALSIIHCSEFSEYCAEEETYLYLCLGQALSRIGKVDLSEAVLNKAIDKAKNLFGNAHHVTAVVLSNSAESMRRARRFDLAERYKKEAIEIYSSGLFENDSHLLTLNSGLGLIWFEAGVDGLGLLRFKGGVNERKKKSKEKGIEKITRSYKKFKILLEDFNTEKDHVNFSTCVNNYAGVLNSPELFDLDKIQYLFIRECIPFLEKIESPFTYNLISISYLNLAKSCLIAINYKSNLQLIIRKCDCYIQALHYTNKALEYCFLKSPNHYEIEMCEILLTISHCFYGLNMLIYSSNILNKARVIMENNFIMLGVDRHRLNQYCDTRYHIYFDIVELLITICKKLTYKQVKKLNINLHYYKDWLGKHNLLKKNTSKGYTYTLDVEPLKIKLNQVVLNYNEIIRIYFSIDNKLKNIRELVMDKNHNGRSELNSEFIKGTVENLTSQYLKDFAVSDDSNVVLSEDEADAEIEIYEIEQAEVNKDEEADDEDLLDSDENDDSAQVMRPY